MSASPAINRVCSDVLGLQRVGAALAPVYRRPTSRVASAEFRRNFGWRKGHVRGAGNWDEARDEVAEAAEVTGSWKGARSWTA